MRCSYPSYVPSKLARGLQGARTGDGAELIAEAAANTAETLS